MHNEFEGRTVCIVDDDSAVLHALAFELTTQGYKVEAYSNARALMDLPEIAPDACLIVDQRLQDFEGLYVIEYLRARNVTSGAILITSNPSTGLRLRAASIGVPVVEKPLIHDDLSLAVRSALSRTGSGHAMA